MTFFLWHLSKNSGHWVHFALDALESLSVKVHEFYDGCGWATSWKFHYLILVLHDAEKTEIFTYKLVEDNCFYSQADPWNFETSFSPYDVQHRKKAILKKLMQHWNIEQTLFAPKDSNFFEMSQSSICDNDQMLINHGYHCWSISKVVCILWISN